MRIGLIGSGNMARALAVGWSEPVLCTDVVPERATALAGEVGGEAVGGNVELARQADLVVLCHKPAQLDEVASEIAGEAKAVASILAGVDTTALQRAYPGTPVFRFMPNVPVEIRRGVVCYARTPGIDAELEAAVLERFEVLGTLVALPEALMDTAMGVMGCSPAYVALIAEAQVDAAVQHGLPAADAAELVVETLAGTAELIRARGMDTLAVRRQVTSPGGTTARGVAALERAGLRAAFAGALDAVLARRAA